MTARLINAMRMHMGGMDAQVAQPRWGTVQSVDPVHYTAKVLLQPEGVLTGWLPVVSPWVGSGFGAVSPPVLGQQVNVIADTGDHEHGIILGGTWSQSSAAPQPPTTPGGQNVAVKPGEWAAFAQNGNYVRLSADGSVLLVSQQGASVFMNSTGITINGGGSPVHITNGDLHVDGNIIGGFGTADQVTLLQHRHGTVGSTAAATIVPTPGT
jgi:phage baseplate assembly protein V